MHPALFSTALLLAAATWTGIAVVQKLIQVHEARHELKLGSAGFLRMIGGWFWIGIWLLATWFLATICGDWYRSGDLSGAVDRSMLRLYVIMEIAVALSEADG